MFISAALLKERRETEKERQERFHHNHPHYIPHSHTSEEIRKRSKEYRTIHSDKISFSYKKWSSQNMDKLRLLAKTRYAKDANVRARTLTASALRRSQQDRLTGTNKIEVNFLYALSKALSFGGIKHVVDHYLPIKPQHGLYCGLTNSANLRIIPQYINAIKKNKCPLYGKAA